MTLYPVRDSFMPPQATARNIKVTITQKPRNTHSGELPLFLLVYPEILSRYESYI